MPASDRPIQGGSRTAVVLTDGQNPGQEPVTTTNIAQGRMALDVNVVKSVATGGGGAAGDVNIHDGAGAALTSTPVGADRALDVNIVSGTGGTSMVDDAPITPGVTTFTPAGAMLDDVAPDSVDEGDGGILRMSANRNLYVTLRDALGNEQGLAIAADNTLGVNDAGNDISIDDGGNSITVDDGGVPLEVDLALVSGAAVATNAGNADAGTQRVVIASNQVEIEVEGDTADDAVDAGNPVKIGALAKETDGSAPGFVAEADRADLIADLCRRLLVNIGHPNTQQPSNNNYAVAKTNEQQIAAPGAGLHIYITGFIMTTDTAMNIEIVDDTAGAATTILGPYYFTDNGGTQALGGAGWLYRVDVNTNVGITSSVAGNHTVTIFYYIAP